MQRRSGWVGATGGALLALCLTEPVHAADAESARAQAQEQLTSVRADLTRLRAADSAHERPTHPPEQLIAAGDLSLRTKDYEQAIDTFCQVVELFRQGKADRNTHADGLFSLAEAYFESGQLLSAR